MEETKTRTQINQRATPETARLLDDLARETGMTKSLIQAMSLRMWAQAYRSGTLVLSPETTSTTNTQK